MNDLLWAGSGELMNMSFLCPKSTKKSFIIQRRVESSDSEKGKGIVKSKVSLRGLPA